MATVAKLVETLAQALMIPTADVQHRARRLRDARMLPAEGFGRGAPHVESGDCARLLVAILATETATHAPEAVSAVDRNGPAIHGVYKKTDVLIAPPSTFVAAIAYIIERLKDPATRSAWFNLVRRVGVRQTGNSPPFGWIQTSKTRREYGVPKTNFLQQLTQARVTISPKGAMTLLPRSEWAVPGLTRELFVEVRELVILAALLERG